MALAGAPADPGCGLADPPTPSREMVNSMHDTLRYLTLAAPVAVALVLLAGLWNMMRGRNPNLSQKLMRWRVGLQFLAIAIAMLVVYLLRG